jgi:hypothetical protein
VPECGSITFITGGLPLGFSVPEVPSTHLFKYPDLGIAMINGFAAEQSDRPGIWFVALVDHETTKAHEMAAAERLLPPHDPIDINPRRMDAVWIDRPHLNNLFRFDHSYFCSGRHVWIEVAGCLLEN